MNENPPKNEAQQVNAVQPQNPYENVIKRTESFVAEIQKLESTYNDLQVKIQSLSEKEKSLKKESNDIAAQQNKLENELKYLLQTVHSFLQQTLAYASEVYRRNQAEIKYWTQAEASQRAVAEAAQKVLTEAAQRAQMEAEYRRKADENQKQLIEQTLKSQAEAAQRIKAEITKTGSIILDNKRMGEPMPKEKPVSPETTLKKSDTDLIVKKEKAEKEQGAEEDKKKFSMFGKKN